MHLKVFFKKKIFCKIKTAWHTSSTKYKKIEWKSNKGADL